MKTPSSADLNLAGSPKAFYTVPICKKQRRGIDVTDANFKGTLAECLQRAGIEPETTEASRFTVKWYRGQMRAWAGWWRDSFGFSAYGTLCHESETASTALYFAKMYRDNATNLALKLKGAA